MGETRHGRASLAIFFYCGWPAREAETPVRAIKVNGVSNAKSGPPRRSKGHSFYGPGFVLTSAIAWNHRPATLALPVTHPTPSPASPTPSYPALDVLRDRVRSRVDEYLTGRSDEVEQRDHLSHVSARLHWIYAREQQRLSGRPEGAPPAMTPHDRVLTETVVLSHDIGKWVSREALGRLLGPDPNRLAAYFDQLNLTVHQRDLFLLGVRRRLALPQDAYLTEYDSVHHLVSAFLLAADPSLSFGDIAPADQERLLVMIIGHQFGGYFKENLLALSLGDDAIRTGMLVDVSRPDWLRGDLLASAFHDADIADLLFVGSVARGDVGRPGRFHAGGLLKILIVNVANYVRRSPRGPKLFDECFRMVERTIRYAADELLTPTARAHGARWKTEAMDFLRLLQEPKVARLIRREVAARDRAREETVARVRALFYRMAEEYVRGLPGL